MTRAARLALGTGVGLAGMAGFLLPAFGLIWAVGHFGLPPLSLGVILPAYGVALVWLNIRLGGPF